MRFEASERSKIRRAPKRTVRVEQDVQDILDEGWICHVAFVQGGQPFQIPMFYIRHGDRLCIHGSNGSRLIKHLSEGHPTCVSVTLLDGLVLAKSAYHHSMNYRSVMAFGAFEHVEAEADRREIMDRFVERIAEGRAEEARRPNKGEFRATTIVALMLDEVSAKRRVGPPNDDDQDLELPVWAGEIPLRLLPGSPVPAEHNNVALPDAIREAYS